MTNYTYSLPVETGYNVTQGVHNYFGWIGLQDPSFLNYFLIFLWSVIFIGGTLTEKKLIAKEEYTKWGFIASLITFGIALILGFTTTFNSGAATIVSLAVLIAFIVAEFYP